MLGLRPADLTVLPGEDQAALVYISQVKEGMTTDMFICKPNLILLSMKQKQRKSPEQTTSCFGRAHSKPKPCPQELLKKKAKRKKAMVDFGLLISCKGTQSHFTKNLSNINEILESDVYQFLLAYLTWYA